MKRIVALPFRHQASLVCDEARQMLLDAGFEIVCNETGARLPREEQKALIKDAYAIIAGTETYDRDMLAGCENLKTIIRFGVGTDNLDLEAMREMGIQVGVIANYNSVAEFALILILSAMKSLPLFDAEVRRGGWGRYPMRELRKKTVGIAGFGRIGRRLAELLQGFDVTILAYDPYLDEAEAEKRNVKAVTFDELLEQSDVVSLHMPLTEDTYHLMNEKTFAKMKDGAYLVNTARGKLVDEHALAEALMSGKLSGAGLDVFETEPVTSNENPLFALKNTVLAPHVSAASFETNYNGGLICAESIIRVASGERPLYPLV